jgi:hypothetical protein
VLAWRRTVGDTKAERAMSEPLQMSLRDIQRTAIDRVERWEPGIWSWPHDSFMNYEWGYALHEASVKAWNEENRQMDCKKFLLGWLADVSNIEKAISKYGLSCFHERLDEDGVCRSCGADCRGIGGSAP